MKQRCLLCRVGRGMRLNLLLCLFEPYSAHWDVTSVLWNAVRQMTVCSLKTLRVFSENTCRCFGNENYECLQEEVFDIHCMRNKEIATGTVAQQRSAH